MHSLNITRCIKHGVKRKVHHVQRKQIDSHKVRSKCPPLAWTQAHNKCVNGQLRRQSATALSHATHAVDDVAAHRCHELWSHTHVAQWQTMAPDMRPPNSPDLNLVDYAIWSVIQLNAAGNILTVHYKHMKCDVSFSLGSVSTLFRWGGHFCHICVKCFLKFTTVQKLHKSIKIFQSYDHKCTATFFMVHSVKWSKTVDMTWN